MSGASYDKDNGISVLNVLNSRKPFVTQQIKALENYGVNCTTICVPNDTYVTGNANDSRTLMDYLRFYPNVITESLHNYDIVHSHYGLTAPYALTQPTRPIVLSLWGRDLFGKFSWLSKLSAKHFDAVIVRSEEMRKELDCEAHIVDRGVDLNIFQPMPKKECQIELGWDPTKNHVLFPYSPNREKKNYPLAESVINSVNKKVDSEVVLHAVYNEKHEDIPTFFNASDLLLMTSISEGSPNTVKEALGCNTPIVSTDVGDVRKLLSEVDGAHIVNKESELVESCISVLRSNTKFDGRQRAEDLSWERTVDQLMSIYGSVL